MRVLVTALSAALCVVPASAQIELRKVQHVKVQPKLGTREVCWSGDGRIAVLWQPLKTVLLDVETGEQRVDRVTGIVLSGQSDANIVVVKPGSVHWLDAWTLEERRSLPFPRKPRLPADMPNWARWTSDRKALHLGWRGGNGYSSLRRGALARFDLESGELQVVRRGAIITAARSPSGAFEAVAVADDSMSCQLPMRFTVRLRDRDRQMVSEAVGSQMFVAPVLRFDPAERMLIWTDFQRVHAMGLGAPLAIEPVPAVVHWWSFVDARHALSHDGQRITVWRLPELEVRGHIEVQDSVRTLAKARLEHSLESKVVRKLPDLPGLQHLDRILAAALSPDRRRLLLAGHGDLVVYDVAVK